MLSKSCEYAIRSVIFISAYSNEEKKVGIKEIAKTLDIPAPFLAKIMQTLVRDKIVASTKGPNGGFYLEKSYKKVTLLDIVAVIDGMDIFKRCALGLKRCSDAKPCPMHGIVKTYRDEMRAAMAEKTLEKLIEELDAKKITI